MGFAVVGGVILLRAGKTCGVNWIACLIALYAMVPVGQYFLGLVDFVGCAWLGMLFLAGFALSILIGELWDSGWRNQPIDGLFLAIGMAAVGSVALQLCQWLGLDIFGIWMVPGDPSRPFANLAQPNNLATLLLWGCLACAWGYWRKLLCARVALTLGLYLVFGIALTQSRTALLGMLLVVMLTFLWRNKPDGRWLFHSALVLSGFLLLSLIAIPLISKAMQVNMDSRFVSPELLTQDAPRKVVYRLFLEASLNRTLFGYGWSNTGEAFFATVASYPELGVAFYHTHNLFLDLLVWFGWPLGLLLIVAGLCWVAVAFRSVESIDSAILCLFLLFVGVHSMVEFPLHYASFLLPVGLVIGVLNSRLSLTRRYQISRWPVLAIFVIGLIGLGVIVRDYALFEDDVRALRFERMNIKVTQPRVGSEILLLTQLKAFLEVSHEKPRKGLSRGEIAWHEKASLVIFNPLNSFNFIQTLALNGHVPEAQIWVGRIKHALPGSTYVDMSQQWAKAVALAPELSPVSW